MIYIEHQPAAPLDRFIRMLWYARAPKIPHRRERILPSGCVQVILNLAKDYLHDCTEGGGERAVRVAPALIIGARSVYEIVDCSDMADLIGIIFEPGGFPAFARDAADQFSNRSVSLDDVWGGQVGQLRNLLRQLSTPQDRLCCLERFLLKRVDASVPRNPMVEFALSKFGSVAGIATVREVARSTGWSERRFSQVFREEVGLSPKTWCRIQRFQRTVKRLHAGVEIKWAELALDCGYYDQSHFANEFRAFSGIDATTYSATRGGPWSNHVPVE